MDLLKPIYTSLDVTYYKAPLHMECFCDIGRGRGWVRNVYQLIGGIYARSSQNV